ncbi:GH25 family lysozyme [Oceanivirga salmonicida]|nr:GH25 family lysozyme [Oceanivirga salmonicida]
MKKINKILIIILVLINLFLILLNIEFSGYFYHNDINASKYEIHGIDISHHQIRINWQKVDKNYKFVLIKATEGKDFSDKDFLYNWNKARLNGFAVGAYHFFSMTSSGKDQAKYYISKVPRIKNSFPPIIDVELSSKYEKEKVIKELVDFIKIVEKHYKKKVIIYTDYKSYTNYIKNNLVDNYLWFRDIRKTPYIEENDRWIIWQYSNRGLVDGISGFTDKNVLRKNDINWYINEQGIK